MATIKDVAKKAGVSPSTVSRTLKDNSAISEETKIKVTNKQEKKNQKKTNLLKNYETKKDKIFTARN